ncbi:Flagellin [Thalassoglobus neptunius]|uniref:Flagellin n=1 Tax=Thalassoglobus neptunius TaxID=1938619 RepID=A0A5C5VYD8_9PLAN|nr:Flagellin [Thalassoglobus neptunius]
MGLTIANNVTSLNAQNNLTRANTRLTKSVERLSSGLKINRGADGPAALVISEKQRAQISGLKQAIENTEKAVSLVQTAEGALGEINSEAIRKLRFCESLVLFTLCGSSTQRSARCPRRFEKRTQVT